MDYEVFGNMKTADGNHETLQQLFTRSGASQYLQEVWNLKFAAQTLAKLATLGGGPRYHKAGRTPLYPKDELDSFAREKLGPLLASTSEMPEPEPVDQVVRDRGSRRPGLNVRSRDGRNNMVSADDEDLS
ncbi:MAG: hypothetical protein AAGD43_18225 [Pseudomonadota bacterium]